MAAAVYYRFKKIHRSKLNFSNIIHQQLTLKNISKLSSVQQMSSYAHHRHHHQQHQNANKTILLNNIINKNIERKVANVCFQQNSIKHYSSQHDQEQSDNNRERKSNKRSLPQLMPFSEIVWPSLLKTIKNHILVYLIIKPYFDNDFNLKDFTHGAKYALNVVSTKLAMGDISGLSGLVAPETITQLQKSVSDMSVAQRNEIMINKDDIYLAFPYQIGIMFDDDDDVDEYANDNNSKKKQRRWVEITIVFHVLRGLQDMVDRGISPPLNVGILPEYRGKLSVCNYRFIKEFTQGIESDWTVNVANHFKPSDLIRDQV